MLTIANLTYRIGGRTLLDAANAQIPAGAKVGLVGRNGTGKSTLIDLVRGAREPDAGDIELPRHCRIGFLAQEAPSGAATPRATVLAADTERAALLQERGREAAPLRLAEIEARLFEIGAAAAPARAARLLAGLGLGEAMQQARLDDLSGGWRMRVALAAVLFAEPDLLLLDEPTNHLDLEAAIWLERHLRVYPRTLVLVSHDRRFLNAVATTTLHLERGKLTLYAGGFDAFVRARQEARALAASLARRQVAERERLQTFIDRFRAKASKARQAQSRLKALARLQPVALAEEEPPPTIRFPDPPCLAPPLISFDQASVGYLSGKPVLSRLDLRLDPDDRIALVGANGNGKTTLARLIAGRLDAMSGEMRRAPKLACGYFAQHQIEELRVDRSAFDHLAALMPQSPPERVRTRLGGFGFGADKAFLPVADLSGGERARLNLALVSVDAPALLVLDEPTNHLDLEAREALVAALNEFPGAVVLVSHDRHLVELVADRLWLVADGTVRPFAGDLDDYRALVLDSAAGDGGGPAAGEGRRAERRRDAERRRALEPLRLRSRHAEETLARLAVERDALDRALSAPQAAFRQETAAALKRRAELDRLIEAAERDWLAAEEALDRNAQQ
ncbi:MAG TPA: ABC-F family ATP-binding cassette domain-containing protein [Stellaceae bacterium]|nr:ABC-F family ATP-binding cassette domain-containing protein [Stellaceae bacterium]